MIRPLTPVQEHRRKATIARGRLRYAVHVGKIVKPTACSRCAEELPARLIQGHHADHDKPLEVEWLCYPCHKIETDKQPHPRRMRGAL